MSPVQGNKETHLDDFGIDHRLVTAFTRSGLWDDDPSDHLNIHSCHQIIVVNRGMVIVEEAVEKRPLYRGMAAFIPAGKAHLITTLRDKIDVRCHSLFIVPAIYAAPDDGIRIFETSELCRALLTSLNEQNLVDISGGISGHCLRLFLEILPSDLQRDVNPIKLPEPQSSRVRRIVTFLQDNHTRRVKLEDLTRVVSLSIRQICRSFKSEMKITTFEYLKIYRLLHASSLLSDREKKVIDVSHDCGFESVSTFFNEFKRYFGISPDRFRGHRYGELP